MGIGKSTGKETGKVIEGLKKAKEAYKQ